ncbi:MAG: Nif3-like dinuclear metal center hexameric protein [Chloroflexota bacterium]|nr:Nif3-like dinuclear metal center hexameric protein [Chloroflexota bacterium]
MNRNELTDYLDRYLRINEIEDYGPQGLQVEGADEVSRIAFTVDAGLPCIDAAVKVGAQMQIVHHGVFWGQAEPLRGGFGRRIHRLFETQLNLYAAHLPLDAHPEVGNNAELARILSLVVDSWFCNVKGTDLGVVCSTPEGGIALESLVDTLTARLGVEPRVLAHGPTTTQRIAILSGAGASHAGEAANLGADTLITGETSHSQFYSAHDHQINLIFAGHYATETVGLKALGRHLNGKFGLETVFIDLPTGM